MNTDNGDDRRVCERLAAALVLAADDELSADEWRVVEQHLSECQACRVQWAAFGRTDSLLLECRAELNELSPPDPAVRARLVSALSAREHIGWPRWLPGQGKWGWAAASLASLTLAALVGWTIHRQEAGAMKSAAAVTAPDRAEVVRVNLPLAPGGDPFLDGSQAESLVLADVAIGSEGQPTGMKLAE